jgi:hypothetical protein
MDPLRDQIAMMGLKKGGGGWNPYAAGPKTYGIEGRPQATQGPLNSPAAKRGYQERDRDVQARKQAVLSRMQAARNGQYMDRDFLRGIR